MKLFQWFDTEEIDRLVQAIVTELGQRVPPSALDSHDRKAAARLRNTHDAIFARAGKFARERTLNIYKKAHLGNRFRWALKEAGYPPEFVESWTYELVSLIAMNLSARK